MRSVWTTAVLALSLATLVACSNSKQAEMASAAAPADSASAAPGRAGGAAESLGVKLAYEHEVDLKVEAADIPKRLRAAQDACNGGKFGPCAVLGLQQQGGDVPSASLQVRVVPAGVDPLIALAGKGDEIASRNTHAEDLAVVMRDNTLLQDRLRKEHARLLEFQGRSDLKIQDMMVLSNQIAQIEAQLQGAQQEGAQQQRRVDTQLLTLRFNAPQSQANRSEIGQALGDFGAIVTGVVAWMIRAFAVLLPLGVVVLGVVWLVRLLRRRGRKAA
ncbi:DUF4349 domain-containing protein [Lysobacter sp. 5GHs7-4]|uniref:DUF4349 domain-containing protein n=1 Tax=Lysobacter sp. 5GHs7-4 TaxID=2904253 RepID=UPI001E44066D|nr:DUF4349 domain-containing protein [Lysobacter sp. 5GHs7-4]UHQ24511.1 DUF4349 domain-containing protein [Lysobacter sp. 5GHs7-4]